MIYFGNLPVEIDSDRFLRSAYQQRLFCGLILTKSDHFPAGYRISKCRLETGRN
jgi:hypothetical protein